MNKLLTLAIAALLCTAGLTPAQAAEDPALISFGAQAFDWFQMKDIQTELRVEYRGEKLIADFKPYASMAGIYCKADWFPFCEGDRSTGSGFFGGGMLLDIYFGNRIVLTPSFGPNYYTGGNRDLDLDSPLVFRGQLELAWRFDDYSRFGIAISRYDNLGLGDRNPGADSAGIYYSVPFDSLFGKD
ncbi:MAG: acyloxyacyl hydrolase [Rhodospirillaceae bacterium]|nr:acyloxyacyl hydrolase [Rhodospirillaceae bacterium]